MASAADIEVVAANMGEEDLKEFHAAGLDIDPVEWALNAARQGPVWIATTSGDPIAIYGLLPVSVMSRTATPWLMPTPLIAHRSVVRAMAAYGGVEVRRIAQGYRRLAGQKMATATREIRWLKWLGFTVGEVEMDVNGHRFLSVTMDLET